MFYLYRVALSVVACAMLVNTATAREGAFPVQQGFLDVDPGQFEVRKESGGVDLVYIAPGALERLGKYSAILVDQPEIWIAEDSKYGGAKPDDLRAIAELIREGFVDALTRGGHKVVDEPGPGVVLFRIALTDLYLKKKKRRLLAYTPIGATTKLVADQIRDMMGKVDIIEMALQAEFADSTSGEVLGAVIVKRGARKDKKAGQKEVRMDFEEFSEVVKEYAARTRCRFDNGKLPPAQWVDCTDAGARAGG